VNKQNREKKTKEKKNKINNVGRFFWKSISAFPTDLPTPKEAKFKFNVRLGSGGNTKRISMVDVGALQAMPEYRVSNKLK
jgi:hypothetical protein